MIAKRKHLSSKQWITATFFPRKLILKRQKYHSENSDGSGRQRETYHPFSLPARVNEKSTWLLYSITIYKMRHYAKLWIPDTELYGIMRNYECRAYGIMRKYQCRVCGIMRNYECRAYGIMRKYQCRVCGIMRNHKMLNMRYYAELYTSADSEERNSQWWDYVIELPAWSQKILCGKMCNTCD